MSIRSEALSFFTDTSLGGAFSGSPILSFPLHMQDADITHSPRQLRPALPRAAPSPAPAVCMRAASPSQHYTTPHTISVRRFLGACRQSLHGQLSADIRAVRFTAGPRSGVEPLGKLHTYASGELQSAWTVRMPRGARLPSLDHVRACVYLRTRCVRPVPCSEYVSESQAADTPALAKAGDRAGPADGEDRRHETRSPARGFACQRVRAHRPCRLHLQPPSLTVVERTEMQAHVHVHVLSTSTRGRGTRRQCQSDPAAHVGERRLLIISPKFLRPGSWFQ